MSQFPVDTVQPCKDNGQCTDGDKHDFDDEETNAHSSYGNLCSKCFCLWKDPDYSGGRKRRKIRKKKTKRKQKKSRKSKKRRTRSRK